MAGKRMTRPNYGRASRTKRSNRIVRRQRSMSNLTTTRVPIHLVYYSSTFADTEGRLYASFNASMLFSQYKSAFQEMRVLSLTVTLIPEARANALNGQYTSIILDGDAGLSKFSWSQNWFKAIACMPGAKLRKRGLSTKLFWKPTEPEDKNFFTYDSSHAYFDVVSVASNNPVDWTSEERRMNFTISVKGHLLGRMIPWKSNITRLMELAKVEETSQPNDKILGVELDDLCIDSPSP